jgi:hypothetical protein
MVVECLGGSSPSKCLAGAGVEGGGDGVEFGAAVSAEVGALGDVLAQQAVGVFVGAALPGWLCHLLREAFIAVFGSHTSLLEKINIGES